MAVIISNGSRNINAASGFYRVEASNLMPASGTTLALTSARQIAVTFANAGNCQGIGLYLLSSATATNDRSIVVTLQENVATVWTDRAAVTLTAAQIKAVTSTLDYFEDLIVPFVGGTFPYAVDTSASKWRFNIVQSGGTTGTWALETSDGTNPAFFTWCDNALSYTSGDTLICKDVVTINASTTLGGVLSTGVTTTAIACVVCRGADPSVANLTWENPPASSYTLTLNGAIIISARGGWRIGTSAARIAYAQQASVVFGTPSAGTYTGIIGFRGSPAGRTMRQTRQSIWMYGEIPTYTHTTLASDAAAGQKNLTTTDATGWQPGDVIAIGRQDVIGTGESTAYTINTISTTAIATTVNIGTNNRKAGGQVINLSRYGVKLTAATGAQWQMGHPANLIFSGCILMDGATLFDAYLHPASPYAPSSSITAEDSAWTAAWLWEYCALRIPTYNSFFNGGQPPVPPEKGLTIQNCVVLSGLFCSAAWTVEIASGPIVVQNNVFLAQYANQAPWQLPSAGRNTIISGNVWENGTHAWILHGISATIQNNTFWGAATYPSFTDTGVLRIGTLMNSTLGGNAFSKCAVGLGLGRALSFGCTTTGDTFGVAAANTIDVDFAPGYGVIFDILMASPGSFVPSVTYLPNVTNGSILRATTFAGTTNRDQSWLPYGYLVRAGDGLSDTTVRTSGTGKFALRFQPTSGTNLLKWAQAVPTGAISTKTMTVSCWVYIASSAYAAGTHTKPQLSVLYDNTTTITATATATYGSWQQLAVTFTPATSYGQITVTVQGATDAAGSNAYFYVDDFNIAYPAGVSVDLGGLDLWANALPVAPTLATVPALGGVWDEALSAHTVSGSFGAFVKKLLTVAKFVGLK